MPYGRVHVLYALREHADACICIEKSMTPLAVHAGRRDTHSSVCASVASADRCTRNVCHAATSESTVCSEQSTVNLTLFRDR